MKEIMKMFIIIRVVTFAFYSFNTFNLKKELNEPFSWTDKIIKRSSFSLKKKDQIYILL